MAQTISEEAEIIWGLRLCFVLKMGPRKPLNKTLDKIGLHDKYDNFNIIESLIVIEVQYRINNCKTKLYIKNIFIMIMAS